MSEKIKEDFKICEECFLWFNLDIDSLRLIGNFQYMLFLIC